MSFYIAINFFIVLSSGWTAFQNRIQTLFKITFFCLIDSVVTYFLYFTNLLISSFI